MTFCCKDQFGDLQAPMAKLSFNEHPASVGETYCEHMTAAFGFGGRMLLGGLACIVHGLLPFVCTSTGSRTIALLHDRMLAHRKNKTLPLPDASTPAVDYVE